MSHSTCIQTKPKKLSNHYTAKETVSVLAVIPPKYLWLNIHATDILETINNIPANLPVHLQMTISQWHTVPESNGRQSLLAQTNLYCLLLALLQWTNTLIYQFKLKVGIATDFSIHSTRFFFFLQTLFKNRSNLRNTFSSTVILEATYIK